MIPPSPPASPRRLHLSFTAAVLFSLAGRLAAQESGGADPSAPSGDAPPSASEAEASSDAPAAAPVTPPAGPVTLKGRLLDGTTMARSYRVPQNVPGHDHPVNPLSSMARIPLTGQKFEIHMIAGPNRGKRWEGTADADGGFSIDLGVRVPPGPCLVAVAQGPKALYSPAVAWAPGPVEFRCYRTTESDQFVQGGVEIQHALVKDPSGSRMDLEVGFRLLVRNLGAEMYVGRPYSQKPGERTSAPREVFRVPVPKEAEFLPSVSSKGTWTEFPGEGRWRWLVLDSPIPPFLEEAQAVAVWDFRYRMPARQSMVTVFPIALSLIQFGAAGGSEDLVLSLKKIIPPAPPDEHLTDVLSDVEAGSKVALEVRIDNALLGQPNFGSLLILGGFFLAAALAVAIGLLLGRKGPPLEALLREASGDEVVARIAQLDMKNERGEVSKKEYQEIRAKLLSMARYMVGELASGGVAGGEPPAAGPAAGAVLPRAAQDLLARLRSLESEGPLDAGRIHERAVLLEELARTLSGARGPWDKKERVPGR